MTMPPKQRVGMLCAQVLAGKGHAKGDGNGNAKGDGKGNAKNQSTANDGEWLYPEKIKKVRENWTMPEYGGGMTLYSSETFIDGHGKWFSGWHDPDAKVHEDIWIGERAWVYLGHYFWPEHPGVELTEEEYEHLFPGLQRHGIPDANNVLHKPKRKSKEDAKRMWKRRTRYAKRQYKARY